MWDRIFKPSSTAVAEPWFPHVAALEMEESEKEFVVRVELPEFTQEEIEVEVCPQYLMVRARHEDQAEPGKEAERVEELARKVDLPPDIALEGVTAVYRKGVLVVTLPRKEEEMPVRKVPVTL